MKKLLIIALLPLSIVAMERLTKKPFYQTFGSDLVELNIVNASKKPYSIIVTTSEGKYTELLPGQRSGTLEVPYTSYNDNNKAQIKLNVKAFKGNKDVADKDYIITYNLPLGTPIRSEAPTITIKYNEGGFFSGQPGFIFKPNHLFTDFKATDKIDVTRYSMM